ncbi:Endonuclease YncB, thermonuclease family [Pseudoxanthobacter soli DSM 19599]|uniref:Endonuclease YncB, thermonuclease family n=1 Tax=Pseudoxanthobacter soli DSM 19599 TaxID=1123029 RepID=A0A1M7ZM37_9HYPH|nr:thermonuclease family protein [Pseudoxanthobacter soli]SHO65968.1 Endonuclease YncB, thermonuclease family [Pseudoxanthobacter soli DSM 19599]
MSRVSRLRMAKAAALLWGAVFVPSCLQAAERIAGPVEARVERVIDGDTLAVRAHIWLGQDVSVLVRIRGIDAPELHGRCAAERQQALAARGALAAAVEAGTVTLSAIEADKYGGRILADVASPEAGPLDHHLLGTGLARAYAGAARGGWCAGSDVGAADTAGSNPG